MAHGSNWREFPVIDNQWVRLQDPYVHALTVIQEPHRMAHDGMMFNITGKRTGLVTTGTHEMVFQTGDCYPHLNKQRISVGAGDITIQGYEGATFSSAGTPLVPQNSNRNSSNTPCMAVSYTPTLTTDGVLIHTTWVPPTASGVGQTQSGMANVDAGEEWILKPNTNYLFRITNSSGSTIDLSFDLLWYEASYEEL